MYELFKRLHYCSTEILYIKKYSCYKYLLFNSGWLYFTRHRMDTTYVKQFSRKVVLVLSEETLIDICDSAINIDSGLSEKLLKEQSLAAFRFIKASELYNFPGQDNFYDKICESFLNT